MASGLGKTLTIIFGLQQFLQEQPNAHILYLCNQESILAQSKAKFKKVFGDEYSYGMFTGYHKTTRAVTFLFATFQTMCGYREKFVADAFDYVIVDEAHHTVAETYRPTADYFEPQFLLGLTATKDRLDGRDILDTYEQILYNMDIYDGWEQGWLARVDYRIMLDDLKQEEFEKYVGPHATTEKVSMTQLNKTIFAPQHDEGIVASIREQTADLDNPRMFVFCSSIEHAKAMAHCFEGEAAVIHSRQSYSANQAILGKFRTGKIRIIISVNMMNEGIDVPETDVIVFLRSTESSTIFLQQLGRGLRLGKQKRTVRVLDYVANIERIATILEMEQTAKERIAANPSYTPSANKPEPLVVNIPATKFKMEKVDVEQIITKLGCNERQWWSNEEMLKRLVEKAKELGHSPSRSDLYGDNTMPSVYAYMRRFGSWNNAIKEAGLEPNYTNYTKRGTWTRDAIIAAIKLTAQEIGCVPKSCDCGEYDRMPAASTVKHVFGSWNNAITEAGLKARRWSRHDKIADSDLLALLRAKAAKMGSTPTRKSVDQDPDMPRAIVYEKRFGRWADTLMAAGLTKKKKK